MSIDLIAHWGPREESPEQIANRTVEWIEAVGHNAPSLRNWYRTGLSKSVASKQPIEVTVGGILEIMSKRNLGDEFSPEDTGREGVILDTWNNTHPEANFIVMAGSGIARTRNSFTVDIEDCFLNRKMPGEDALVQIFEHTLSSWQPTVASLGTSELWDDLESRGCSSMSVGWLTYVRDLSGEFNRLLKEHATATKCGQGWVVRLVGPLQYVDPSLVLEVRKFLLASIIE